MRKITIFLAIATLVFGALAFVQKNGEASEKNTTLPSPVLTAEQVETVPPATEIQTEPPVTETENLNTPENSTTVNPTDSSVNTAEPDLNETKPIVTKNSITAAPTQKTTPSPTPKVTPKPTSTPKPTPKLTPTPFPIDDEEICH